MKRGDIPSPVAALFPSAEERVRVDALLSRQLGGATAAIAAASVVPTIDMRRFRDDLAGFDFAVPRPLTESLDWTVAQLQHGIVQMTHPRYFGLFNPAPNFPSLCADRIAGAFNPQLASSGSSPVPVEIEAHVIRAIAARAGLGADAAGHFATGGSEANYTALIAALTHLEPRFSEAGVRAYGGPVAFYASRESHIGWLKFAHQAGIGRAAMRLVATDGHGRMDPGALSAEITADRAGGRVPVLVVATAGTTAAGMIDPLAACAAVARREGLWYHVDAAWGGAALASDRLREALSGIELADSVTIDAHKWFATTMCCAMFITRHRNLLAEVFHASASFMPSSISNADPYLNTMQWSRRFLGLRLFLSMASAGWQGYAQHVERSVAVIAWVRAGLVARGWHIANDSPLAVLCAVPPPALGDVRSLVRRVVASGRAWVAAASFEGRDVVRICATHGASTEDDVDALVAALNGGA